ncbi:MAG: long-chain fatty acid--CoA ligase [Nocardioides sp.]|uniref:long-chain-fatty-acid--CoA ligase n=1 Tax=Nocardioides sp. TaxID=35761 RepID=UPI0039E2426E
MTNLATMVIEGAARHPDRIAVRLDDTVATYADLDELSSRVAGWLGEQGVRPGDRVGLMLPNVVEFPVLYYGVLRAGGIVVPMNPLLKSREVEHYLGDSGARLGFVAPSSLGEATAGAESVGARVVEIGPGSLAEMRSWPVRAEVADRLDDDTAVILYTSGTTGAPKGAELTHANMRRNAEVCAEMMSATGADVIMGCLPLFHVFGQTCALNETVAAGATLTLIARFDARLVLETIERDGVTIFMGVPTMYGALLAAGGGLADTSTLRMCISGGAALPAEVLRRFHEVFGAHILEGYGLSETSSAASFNQLGDTRAGSIGKPIPGVEMRIVDDAGTELPAGDVGEIVIRGHNVMKGYWHRPEATEAAFRDGWFRSGDIGKTDADGFFFVVDRKKELIIRGGFNVYPREIEEVLYEHPAVFEAAVIGIPHETYGEEVGAAVVLKDGASVSTEEIQGYVKTRVAPYKYPRHVWFLDSLPKTGTGKILKREIQPPEDVAAH